MADLLRSQSSIYHTPSCMRGLFQFFDFYQRLHVKKMLSFRRHGDGIHAGRSKSPKLKLKAPSIVKEQDFLETETNLLMEDKVATTKRSTTTKSSSSKARMIALISKLYKKDGRKKNSPLASQLLRTISIHHLECNDYVIPEEIISDSEPSVAELNAHETERNGGSSGPVERFKVLKQRIKDIIKENGTEHHRISMDGFLHKIPYGRKAPEVGDREKLRLLDRRSSDRYETDNGRSKLGIDGSSAASRSIQRSRSLTESLDKYSRLMESMSLRESKRPLERLKSVQEHDRKPLSSKTWGRMLSSPEIGSYDFSNYLHSELSDASGSPKFQTSGLLVSDAALKETERHVEPIRTDTDHRVLIHEHEQSELCKCPDDQETRIEAGSLENLMRPSPVSVLDSSCQEEPVIPMKYSVTEGSDLTLGWATFEEPANEISDEVEIVKVDSNEVQMPIDLADFNHLNTQVDQEDELEFEYVKEILNKYKFGSEDFLELNIARDELDGMSVDDQLLIGLVNEILLDIYEIPLSCGPGLSCFGWPKPMRSLLLEVWTKFSWYLSFQKHPSHTLEGISVRDFIRNDRWMNLKWDTGCVGLEIESVILDNLLEEVIFDFGDSSSMECLAF